VNYILTFEKGQLVVVAEHLRCDDESPRAVITSRQDFNDYMAAEAARMGTHPDMLNVFVSSTLDFPEDFTTDPATIALAEELR